MDILQAARKLRPGTSWCYDGKTKTLTQAEDGTPRVTVPTVEELGPVMESDVYAENRAKEYPPVGDQLDQMWKALKKLDALGVDIGQEGREGLAKIQETKEKNPKP